MKKILQCAALLLLFSALNSRLSTAHAQGTAFTYQGWLNVSGVPANGNYDLAFTLYTNKVAGTPLAGPVTNAAVAVTNGLFATTMDFGSVFTGTSNWLEIAVSTNAANSFITLTPRQQLRPVPYAITAASLSGAVLASSISGTLANANLPASPTVSGTVTAGAFSGNGANVTNVNAAALNGLNATNFWQTGGNNVAAGQFLGSTNNQPLFLKVNSQVAMRFEPTTDTPNVVGGYSGNYVQPGLAGVTIGGGGTAIGSQPNTVTNNGQYGVIAGGFANTVNDYGGAILGGSVNFAAGYFATIGGGQLHNLSGDYGFIGGGFGNRIQTDASYSTIAGGVTNYILAYNTASTIGGGFENTIEGCPLFWNLGDVMASTIAGGYQNLIGTNNLCVTIGGGQQNSVQTGCSESTVGGGFENAINLNAYGSTISGGDLNVIGTNAYDSTIGGGLGNVIETNAYDSTISGGSYNLIQSNSADGTIGGGTSNNIVEYAHDATIGGGLFNKIDISGNQSVIAGGYANYIGQGVTTATISGGASNNVAGPGGVVPGGVGNLAFGNDSFAAGTYATATGNGTFVWADSSGGVFQSTAANQFLIRAAGNVGINTVKPGAPLHVASGSSGVSAPNVSTVGAFESSGNAYLNLLTPAASESGLLFGNTGSTADGGIVYNSGTITHGLQLRTGGNNTQMVITSAGDVGIGNVTPGDLLVVGGSGSPAYCNGTTWVNGSDRNSKEAFAAINTRAVLEKVSALPITEWQYKVEANGTRHLGPVAQDFHAAFGLNGADDRHIATVDEEGVALAAIQGLNQKLEAETKAKDSQIQALKTQNESLAQRLNELESAVKALAANK